MVQLAIRAHSVLFARSLSILFGVIGLLNDVVGIFGTVGRRRNKSSSRIIGVLSTNFLNADAGFI